MSLITEGGGNQKLFFVPGHNTFSDVLKCSLATTCSDMKGPISYFFQPWTLILALWVCCVLARVCLLYILVDALQAKSMDFAWSQAVLLLPPPPESRARKLAPKTQCNEIYIHMSRMRDGRRIEGWDEERWCGLKRGCFFLSFTFSFPSSAEQPKPNKSQHDKASDVEVEANVFSWSRVRIHLSLSLSQFLRHTHSHISHQSALFFVSAVLTPTCRWAQAPLQHQLPYSECGGD